MSETNDGGPAFPLNSPSGTPEYMPARDGMSLRDWFAGQALAGMMYRSGIGSMSALAVKHGISKKTVLRAVQGKYSLPPSRTEE